MQKVIAGSITAACIALILWAILVYGSHPAPSNDLGALIAKVHYACNEGKTIDASYFQGQSTPPVSAGQPPQPGGRVQLILSDGRSLSLKQTLSADGIRYSNGDAQKAGSETIVFWSKGHGAFITETADTKTFDGCIEVAAESAGLPNVYASGTRGFSIRYPQDYRADESYAYTELGPGKDIGGVSFTVGSSSYAGTNLGPDTYLSVEEIPFANPASSTCSAALFLEVASTSVSTQSDSGVDYSLATSSGAGAGNRYDETVYALPGTNPCIAVRYFVHYSVLENYPPGVVQPYDDQALREQFDAMRRALIVQQ